MSTLAVAPVNRQNARPARLTLDKEHSKLTKSFRKSEEEVEYYSNTAHILFHYYNAVEKGNPKSESPPPCSASGKRSIIDMLNDTAISGDVLSHDVNDDYLYELEVDDEDAGDVVFSNSKYANLSRGELLDKFLGATRDDHLCSGGPRKTDTRCKHCGGADTVVVVAEGISVCQTCNTIEEALVESDKPGFKENQKSEISYFCYKRSNHFQEWISQTQGREHTYIPDDVYDQILSELKRQKFENIAELKVRKLKEVMKKLRLNRYFEHISHILCHLNGAPMVNMPPELENQLRRMFQLIQAPFLKHAPSKRKNFLSYSYVLHKFLQLLGQDAYICHFPLLKSRQKLHAQDQIWRDICATLKWEFIPSL